MNLIFASTMAGRCKYSCAISMTLSGVARLFIRKVKLHVYKDYKMSVAVAALFDMPYFF